MLRRRVKDALKRRFPSLVRLRDALRARRAVPERTATPVSPFAHAPAPRAAPPVEPAPPAGGLDPQAVQALLDDMVRPALQGDGGDIHLVKVDGNDVYVTLVGACHACPSATVTMRMGVERLLNEEFPTMGRLIEVGGAQLA
jgi:Fe-S cluster biogenesis protein NfuA